MKGSSHLKTAVVSAFVGAIAATGTVALAGTGVGGIFNLGQTNTVNATSALSGASVGAQLQVTNSGIGSGAQGIGAFNNSVAATLYGRNSGGGPGVSGRADKRGNGVEGVSAGAGASGVYGANTSATGFGVAGRSTGASGIGVFGNNTGGGLGVSGKSTGANGVQGITSTDSASGVYGENTSIGGFGVAGRSLGNSGIGVFGDNTGGGWAGYFTGKVHLDGALDCSGCVGSGALAQSYYQTGSKVSDSSHADNADTVGGQSASALQTHAYQGLRPYGDTVPSPDVPPKAQVSVSLPAGTYLIITVATFYNNAANFGQNNSRVIQCWTGPGGAFSFPYAPPRWLTLAEGTVGNINDSTLVTLTAPTTVSMDCRSHTGPSGGSGVSTYENEILALKLDQLN